MSLGRGGESSDPIDASQLAVMVVPRDQLGAPAKGLDLDDDSGVYGNREGADDTIDPHDTAAALRAGGRLGGYELVYSSPKALDIWRTGGGYSDVRTAVELFDTPSDAAVYLDTQARDFARFEGKTIGSVVRLAKTDVVRITDIGESAWAIHGTASFGKIVTHGTVVAFRRGRIVGSVSIGRGDTREIIGQTRIIARALDHRIEAVLAGELVAKPMPIPLRPGPAGLRRLKAATLSLQDLPAGVSVAAEGRKKTTGDRIAYFRSFKVAGVSNLGSRFLTLRAESRLLGRESEARAALEVLGSRSGRSQALHAFVQSAGIPASHPSIAPLADLPSGTVGSVISLRTPKGPFRAFLITVQVGNVLETLSAFGPAAGMDAPDLAAFAVKARTRLENAL